MNCLCLNTRHAARNLTRLYEEHLRPTGLTPPQFGLLSLLAENPGISQLHIAEALDLDPTTLSRNLRILVAHKWVKRTRSPQDRRQASYAITAAGLETRRHALPHWQRAQQYMQQSLGTDWPTAFSILDRLSHIAT